jgi:hypothetical protein
MKIYMKPVQVICVHDYDGALMPIKWQVRGRDPVLVDHIAECREEKLAGIPTLIYRCQSLIGERERVYELKYEIPTHIWYLYKM